MHNREQFWNSIYDRWIDLVELADWFWLENTAAKQQIDSISG